MNKIVNNYYEIVNVSIFEPHKALFKIHRNDRAECRVLECCNKNNCDYYKNKLCYMLRSKLFGCNRCPYGKLYVLSGFTKRARKYHSWIENYKEQYKDVLRKLSAPNDKIAVVGDYICLPYAQMAMNKEIPFINHDEGFVSGIEFIPKEDFTVDNIIKICNFNPRALFTGEYITSYQKEVIPKFIKDLYEHSPSLYKTVCEKLPRLKEISLTDIGRKAYLNTLNTNVGVFEDIHGGIWVWDGEWLTSKNSKVHFMLVKKFEELKVKPDVDAVVEITDDNQVNKDTIFYNS